MGISLNTIEQETLKDSFIHNLDARIKFILVLMIIVYSVYTVNFLTLFLLEIYVLLLAIVSKISLRYYFKRILLILPFGGFIAVFQPFIKPGIVLLTLPLGITVSYEGLMFGALLLSRLFVCLSCIVLLSSVTPMDEIVKAMRKLGLPALLSNIISMTIRYLFLFFDELKTIQDAQKSRSFDIWNKRTSYVWRLKQIGYTITTLFLKSFEKGERVYFSMLSRGYSGEPVLYNQKAYFNNINYVFLLISITFLIIIELTNYLGIF